MKNLFINDIALNLAINYQGGEIVTTDDFGNYIWAIKVKEAIKMANYLVNDFGFNYDPIQADVIRGRQLTKKEFKKEYSAWRLYISTNDNEKVRKMVKFGVLPKEYLIN